MPAKKAKKKAPRKKTGRFNPTGKWTDFTAEMVKELLGYEEVDPKKAKNGVYPVYKPGNGGTAFVLKKNKANRPFQINLATRYAEQMFNLMWCGQKNSPSATDNGDSWVIDSKGNVVSMAHRGVGLILAEQQRQSLEEKGCDDVLDEIGIDGPITVKGWLVQGVDPKCADTTDTGKPRTLADVFYRRHEFKNHEKDISETDAKKLANALSGAVRLVWLRVNGSKVARGPKLTHSEACRFLESHPLLHDAVWHIFTENQTEREEENNPIHGYAQSMGYAAGLLYLFATSNVDYGKYHEKGSITRKPSTEDWEKAEEFWTRFRNARESGKKETGVSIWNAWSLLDKNKRQEIVLDRDGVCTVLCRAWNAWIEDKPLSPDKLKRGLLNSEGKEKFVPAFELVGGLDIGEEGIKALGLTLSSSPQETPRQVAGSWALGDTVWVQEDPHDEPWKGTIVVFSDNGEEAEVTDAQEETYEGIKLSWLSKTKQEVTEEDEPTGEDLEEVEEEVEEELAF
jgi:hypothetical protein